MYESKSFVLRRTFKSDFVSLVCAKSKSSDF